VEVVLEKHKQLLKQLVILNAVQEEAVQVKTRKKMRKKEAAVHQENVKLNCNKLKRIPVVLEIKAVVQKK